MRSRMIQVIDCEASGGAAAPARRGRAVSPPSIAGCVLIAMACLAGCHQTLFPDNTPRTQFDAYDRMRNQVAPEKEFDALGREQPALRARLGPK